MDRITHQVRLTHWRSIIEQCSARPAGQSARAWLRENGISEKQYYYWQRLIRKEAFDQMAKDLPSPTVSLSATLSPLSLWRLSSLYVLLLSQPSSHLQHNNTLLHP